MAFIPFSATPKSISTTRTILHSVSPDLSAEEALARTKAHLVKLQRRQPSTDNNNENNKLHPQQRQSIAQETLYQEYILQSANSLKQELQSLRLNTKGRKPDLARRLAQYKILKDTQKEDNGVDVVEQGSLVTDHDTDSAATTGDVPYPVSFAGIPLSRTAATALHQAGFLKQPSPIQAAAIPAMDQGESILLHAPTGSGKTIAYVLPITEFLWQSDPQSDFFAVIATPTRELAAQVAGVASTLAPPGSVRLLSHPSNLMKNGSKDQKVRNDDTEGMPRIIVGTAKTIVHSLYGNEDFPSSPTPKPLAMQFLKSVRVLVLDEVDRLLATNSNSNSKKRGNSQHEHEKPAAILAAAVARHTLGQSQVVAASATVGRPLKRELARVLGLPPPQGPRVIVAQSTIAGSNKDEEDATTPTGSSRLVTIPDTVEHYISAVTPNEEDGNHDTASSGQLLIQAYQVIQDIVATAAKSKQQSTRILLVLARGFGISTQQVIGALKHFNCQPEPQSLLDALHENALEGTDHMMQVHRKVSGATGVGQKSTSVAVEESLWVTGEDTVRGLHLDGLDAVVLVGRPKGPDEYTHIAGRTGRAGKSGTVVAVVADTQAPLLRAWETMLQMEWKDYETTD
ncbi:RNA helicase DBP8 [Seminavis robusta]|uniref:ATP-dependent RNA helicase n=1 Tax=Seminavis robusta TaxID=568900 RepID=A0A9N8E2M6_9STRA|nr:RNA helicase DBP8 [Seminavis robusta]|eukprot:Sro493_g154150.1 RNA helicase DBP8 (626) ;mRNA; r:44229-46106